MGQVCFQAKLSEKDVSLLNGSSLNVAPALLQKWIFRTLERIAFELNLTCGDHFGNLSRNSFEDAWLT